MKRMTSFLLCAAILLCGMLSGCSLSVANPHESANPIQQGDPSGREEMGVRIDLMDGVTPQRLSLEQPAIDGEQAVIPTEFAVRLYQNNLSAEKNTLISPVSVLCALAMTANGAKGETLAQMERVLGMTVTEWNAYLKAYLDALPETGKNKLSIANSIWFTEDKRFTVEPDFLQSNADYYGAEIYRAPFDDATLKEINSWVADNTNGMIRDTLDKIPQEAVMYLINAIAFDAEWQEIYKENQIGESLFTTEDGESQKVEMMYSDEELYLEDENAIGFIKPYADSKYAFVALLPKEGMSVQEYVKSMTGEGLASLLAEPQPMTVRAALPKFESAYSTEMSELLAAMGMQDAFDEEAADFTGLGTSADGNIFISRVLHKTFIAVDEKGTKAGAATVVEAANGTSFMEKKEVILDRPFVYMIVDGEAHLPLFIGTMMDMERVEA